MKTLTKTKKQLEELDYPFIGIQLKSGGKVFGHVDRFTPHTVYIKDKHGDILDIPRNYIARAFLLLKGEILDEPSEFSSKSRSEKRRKTKQEI